MSGNSVSSLSSKLAEKLKADQLAVENQTSELLRQHADALSKLSNDALATTEAAIREQTKKHTDWLESHLARQRKLMPDLAKEFNQWAEGSAKRLHKAAMSQIWLGLGISLALILAASLWGWWKVSDAKDSAALERQAVQQQIANAVYQFCGTPAAKQNPNICQRR